MPNEWWKKPELAFIYGDKQQPAQMPGESIGQQGQYGFTGLGKDGISQPGQEVPGVGNGTYKAHESEFIFDANSTNELGPDLLTDTMNAAKNGDVDVNKMREAVGNPKPGFKCGGESRSYQSGGLAPPPGKDTSQTALGKQAENVPKPPEPLRTQAPSPVPTPPVEGKQGDIRQGKQLDTKVQEDAGSSVTGGQLESTDVEQENLDIVQPLGDIKLDPLSIGSSQGTQQDPTDFLRDIMAGDSEYIQGLKNKASQDVGGAGAAATAAMKAEGAMAGMSPEAIASMGVSRQRDVDEQTSDVVGDIALEEARMGTQAARDVFGQELARDQFGLQEDQVQYGKDMDQFHNQLAAGDYVGAAQSFNKIHGTDIDFSKAIEKENLSNFNNALNNMGSAIASGQSFDDWYKTAQADGTFDKLNMTESDVKAMYENMRLQQNPIYQSSQRYQDLVDQGIITQDQMDDILAIQAYMLSNPDGISVSDSFQVKDADGNEIGNFKTKAKADKFMADNPGSTINPLKNGWFELGGVGGDDENAQSYLDKIGVDEADPERVQQFLDAHGGKMDGVTAKQWNDWSAKTGSPSRIRGFFEGTGLEDLSGADKKMLKDVGAAQARIDAGTGTPEDQALVDSLGGGIGVGTWDKSEKVNSGDILNEYDPGGGVGDLQATTAYNKDVYTDVAGSNARDGHARMAFNDDMKAWAEQNAGRMIEIDGKYYKVSDDPIKEGFEVGKINGKSGNNAYSFGWQADALRVIDPETGKVKYVTYGVSGSHWDQNRDKGKYTVDEPGIKVWDE